MEGRGWDRAEDRDKGLGPPQEQRQIWRVCQSVKWGWAGKGGAVRNGSKGHAKLQDKPNSR